METPITPLEPKEQPITNNNTPETPITPVTPEKKDVATKLFGNDNSEDYSKMRGDKAREVINDIDDDKPETETANRPVSMSELTDEDRAAAKAFFWFYDDTTAKWFSRKVYGTWSNSEQFRVYKDLSSPEYKELIDCMAIIYKKWKISFGPEMVVGLSLGISTWMKYQMAVSLSEGLKSQMANQNAQAQASTKPTEKIVDINKNKRPATSML